VTIQLVLANRRICWFLENGFIFNSSQIPERKVENLKNPLFFTGDKILDLLAYDHQDPIFP
jgi:hypothetical protein